ncbi:hypothetical protein V1498_06910 [Peribacillus sp. SCS-26]|uniref:hypothetical protein n=1 Tax=Paraperibacillus marinus TaxID=3115295 RepID=UPI003906D4C8
MSNLFKSLLCIGLTFTLFGCNEEEKAEPAASEPKAEEKAVTEPEPSQEELNAALKKEAKEADFVAVNGGEVAEKTKLFITGEITLITQPDGPIYEFTLTSNEGDGFGVYSVKLLGTDFSISQGDQVTVYGVYTGKNDLGMPSITATILEKK